MNTTINFYHKFDVCYIDDPLMREACTREWNVTDERDAFRLTELIALMRQDMAADFGVDTNIYGIDNFDSLLTFNERHSDQPLNGWQSDFMCNVTYIGRGKSKTIIALSSDTWHSRLVEGNPYDHQFYWLGGSNHDQHGEEFADYNILSFSEDITRVHSNPLIYESSFYHGLNSTIDSLQKMAEYTMALFPDSSYYVVSDCRNGHSGALLASRLNASGCFISGGMSTIDPAVTIGTLRTNDNGAIHINTYASTELGIHVRALAFRHLFTQSELNLYDVIKNSPNTKFKFLHHELDEEYFTFKDSRSNDSLPNLDVQSILTRYSMHNHNLTPEIRKNQHLSKFFNALG